MNRQPDGTKWEIETDPMTEENLVDAEGSHPKPVRKMDSLINLLG